MRMVDLRPTTAPTDGPALTVRASEAAELLRLIGVLIDEEDDASYDIGVERVRRLRERLPAGTLGRLRQVDADPKTYYLLALLAAELPAPAGIETLLASIDDDPATAWRLLLGHHASGVHGRGDHELSEQLIAGDDEALATVQQWDEEAGCPGAVTALLERGAEEHGRLLATAVEAVRPLWEEVGGEAMGAIDRDVAHRESQLAQGVPIGDIVVEATNGYALPTDVAISEVVLMPTYWLRPWIVIARRGSVELLTSVVADEFVALPSEAPSPTLLKLFKALSDEGRLKLLRRMSAGPISLTEACEELDVAKATAHHHLSTLRQAGLVMVHGEGRGKRYGLRDDPPDAARDALASYVQPVR